MPAQVWLLWCKDKSQNVAHQTPELIQISTFPWLPRGDLGTPGMITVGTE